MLSARWFHESDFWCHDGTPYPEKWIDTRLVPLCSQLDLIRGTWHAPIVIVSGYRTPEWNWKVGGAPLSQHIEGIAVDIRPVTLRAHFAEAVADLNAQIERQLTRDELPLVGAVGYYPGKWIHLDTRFRGINGHIARWHGSEIGSEK